MLEVLESREELSRALRGIRAAGRRIGLVPTMGALHDGHRSLLVAAGQATDAVVLSVFVNPLQFDDVDDFERYPRDLEEDLALAEAAGARYCFAPTAPEMYPAGAPVVRVDPGPIGNVLEGASRPGHLGGVATVVAKLFSAVAPDMAFFGEKDYQQLVLVTRLAQDLSFPVTVVGCPTVREPDGLALSSRNRRLSGEERSAALSLYRALLAGREALSRKSAAAAEAAMAGVVRGEPLLSLDYAVARDAAELSEPPGLGRPVRLLIAAKVGAVRLIDNMGTAG